VFGDAMLDLGDAIVLLLGDAMEEVVGAVSTDLDGEVSNDLGCAILDTCPGFGEMEEFGEGARLVALVEGGANSETFGINLVGVLETLTGESDGSEKVRGTASLEVGGIKLEAEILLTNCLFTFVVATTGTLLSSSKFG